MSLADEFRRPQVKALAIGGGILVLLAIAIYFATKRGQGALASSNPNGLNNDTSGHVPEVLVLPPPIIQLQPPPAPGSNPPASEPPFLPPAQQAPIWTPSPLGIPPGPPPPILPPSSSPGFYPVPAVQP